MGYGSSGYGTGGYGSGGSGNGSDDYGSGSYYPDDDLSQNKKGGRKLLGNRPEESDYVEGIVSGYQMNEDNTGFLVAWFKSLIYGVPFVTKSKKHIFQLIADEFDSNNYCAEVHFVGEISSGMINNGERVRVYGSRQGSGAYLAKKIIKLNSNMRVTLKNAIPALVIRCVSILVFIGILGILIGSSGEASVGGKNMNLFESGSLRVVLAVAIAVLTLVFGNKIRGATGLSMKVLWIVALVLIGLLVPDIGVAIILLIAMAWMIKRILK